MSDSDNKGKITKRRKIIIISAATIVCLGILVLLYIFVPSKTWPGKEKYEIGTVLYEGNEYQYRDEIINILFVGVDKYEPIERINHSSQKGFADANFLISIDTRKRTCKITMIPRDIMTSVFWLDENGNIGGSEKSQLTYQYTLGDSPEQCGKLMKQSVSTLLYQVPIHQYFTMTYSSVEIVNDMVGGVDVEILEDLRWVNKDFVLGETVHLEGDAARQYIGERNTKENGTSITRLNRQKQYMEALFNKFKVAAKENPLLILKLCWKLRENVSTDLSIREIVYLASLLPDITMDEITIQRLEGEQVKGKRLEEFYPDEKVLKQWVIDNYFEKR